MLRIDSGAQRQCNQVIRYDAIGCAGAMQTSDHLDEIPQQKSTTKTKSENHIFVNMKIPSFYEY